MAVDLVSLWLMDAVKAVAKNPTFAAICSATLTAMAVVLGTVVTAYFNLKRGSQDSRNTYASEIFKFRIRQIEELYAPLLLHIDQSRVVYEKLKWTMKKSGQEALDNFRLLDHIAEIKSQGNEAWIFTKEILDIGEKISDLILKHAGLIEGGVTRTFMDYVAHFQILRIASEQQLSSDMKDGWHDFGYYPSMLNREVAEGYKSILEHLQLYSQTGDEVIAKLLGREVLNSKAYSGQLLQNLAYYETHAKQYADKFDSFDLSFPRNRFIKALINNRFVGVSAHILDAGCGSGRDTLEFVNAGFPVMAIDASPALLRICERKLRDARSSTNPEILVAAETSETEQMTFDEVTFLEQFDGVWAAASLLHVAPARFQDVIEKLFRALRGGGIMYISLPFGEGEHRRGARLFSAYSSWSLRRSLSDTAVAGKVDIWLSDAQGIPLGIFAEFKTRISRRIGFRLRHKTWINALIRKI